MLRYFSALLIICFVNDILAAKGRAEYNNAYRTRRLADPMNRYRPDASGCLVSSNCHKLHKHVLLVATIDSDLLWECSITKYPLSIEELDSQLARASRRSMIIVRMRNGLTGFLYEAVLQMMADRFGNVTLFVDESCAYKSFLNNYCNRISDECTHMFNLARIIKQIRSSPDDGGIVLTDEYFHDSRWLPVNQEVALIDNGFLTPISLQMQSLASSLCLRKRQSNLVFEFTPLSLNVQQTTYRTDYELDEHSTESSLDLLDILPENPKLYDKNRPPRTRNQPTFVNFHVTVISLDSINEESMTYVADIFLAQSWRDHRLRLPESITTYRILDVRWLNDIWKPDSFFKNAKQVTFHEISVPNHYLWLYHDKTLLYMVKLSLVLSCAMKFESYPHDTQLCSMMIESLSHTTEDLVFRWNETSPLVVNEEIELPQLDIAHNYTSDCSIEYSTGNFTCLAVVFSLRRRLGYHLFHTYIPSALIVVMSWISFWIKPEAIPARVTLGVTSLLTLATQNTQSQQSLPPVSYVKAIDIWMSSCSVFVFLSLMEFAVVNNYMGPVATKAMKGYSDEDLRMADDLKQLQSRSNSPIRIPKIQIPEYIKCANDVPVAVCIDKFSRIFFPASFAMLNVIYWTSFL